MTNPWWICEKCGLIHHTWCRPAKLWCKCGGDVVPDFGAEEEFERELDNAPCFDKLSPEEQELALSFFVPDDPVLY